MTHFITLAIIAPEIFEQGEEAVNTELERLMAPYDQNMEVEAYTEPCYSCTEHAVWKAASAHADLLHGTFLQIREPANAELAKLRQSDGYKYNMTLEQELWDKHTKPWRDCKGAFEKEHKDNREYWKEDGCPDCEGTYETDCTYNPDSKWDWYVVGGRWDGFITGQAANSTDKGFNFGDKHHTHSKNAISMKDMANMEYEYFPLTIVTPDTVWHSYEKMGWFGMGTPHDAEVSRTDAEVSTRKYLIDTYPDCYVVALDAHI